MQKRRRNGSCYDLHEHIYYGFFYESDNACRLFWVFAGSGTSGIPGQKNYQFIVCGLWLGLYKLIYDSKNTNSCRINTHPSQYFNEVISKIEKTQINQIVYFFRLLRAWNFPLAESVSHRIDQLPWPSYREFGFKRVLCNVVYLFDF